MKLFKKLAVVGMALTLCLGAGAALTACDKGESSEAASEATVKGYDFKVLMKNGDPAVGYQIQLCIAGGTTCLNPVNVGADGTLFYEADTTKSYEVHVMKDNKQLAKTEYVASIIKENHTGTITVTINQ